MPIDQSSLLLAIGFSAAALSLTLLLGWLSSRSEGYQLSWALGIVVIVISVVVYTFYSRSGDLASGGASFASLTLGFAILAGAARQFHVGHFPYYRVGAAALVMEIPLIGSYILGYDGLGTGLVNLWVTLFILSMMRDYWARRAEAPLQIKAMFALYFVVALSFLACAFTSLFMHPLHGAGAPYGLVEDINSIVVIIGLTGLGALSLSLNQSLLARRHHTDAMTDSLTGLINRRALFERFGETPLVAHTAIIVFDLDHFKTVNDHFGHAMGDEVLKGFAISMQASLDPQDVVARLGGEEFVLVMTRATADIALLVAERIRARFSTESFDSPAGPQRCTVSAGIAYTEISGESFDTLLARADSALYAAKRAGRNRVGTPGLKLVA